MSCFKFDASVRIRCNANALSVLIIASDADRLDIDKSWVVSIKLTRLDSNMLCAILKMHRQLQYSFVTQCLNKSILKLDRSHYF